MAVVTQHKFVSAKADGADTTLVRPSNWNAGHDFVGGATGALLVRRSGESDGADWSTNFVGPYAIGAATNVNNQLLLSGTFTPSAAGTALGLNSTIAAIIGSDAYNLNVSGTLNKAASGTHSDFVGALFQPPIIGAGAAALTNASTVKITGAPTGATNNYALWVAAGTTRLGGRLQFIAGTSGVLITGQNAGFLDLASGSTAIRFSDSTEVVERMRLTDGGILALGTTVTTGAAAGELALAHGKGLRVLNSGETSQIAVIDNIAIGGIDTVRIAKDANVPVTVGGVTTVASAAAGDLILANGKALRGVNAAGNDTHPLIALQSSNQIQIGNGSQIIAMGAPNSLTGATVADVVLQNAKALRFVNAAGTSTANYGLFSNASDNLLYAVPAATDVHAFLWGSNNRLQFAEENSGAQILFLNESTADHAAPAANQAVLYTKDIGTKTALMARFNTGAAIALAIQDGAQVIVLDRDVTTNDVVSTALETTVYTKTITGGTLGSANALRLTLIGDYLNNQAASRNLTIKVKYGGTIICEQTITAFPQSAIRLPLALTSVLSANNATNAQVSRTEGYVGANGNADGAGANFATGSPASVDHFEIVHNAVAVDSTVDQTFEVTFQHNDSAATLSARCFVAILELLG